MAWVVVVLLAVSTSAFAATCPVPNGASSALESFDAEVRLRFLKQRLDSQVTRGKLWMGLWGGAYGLLTVGQMGVTGYVGEEQKKDLYVGSAAALVGTLTVLLASPKVIAGTEALEKELATAKDVCEQVALAERTVHTLAEDQRVAKKPVAHIGNVIFNIGLGLIVGLGFGHWTAAIINTLVGIAVGEALIFSRPSGLTETERRYREGAFGSDNGTLKAQLRPVQMRDGVGVAFSF